MEGHALSNLDHSLGVLLRRFNEISTSRNRDHSALAGVGALALFIKCSEIPSGSSYYADFLPARARTLNGLASLVARSDVEIATDGSAASGNARSHKNSTWDDETSTFYAVAVRPILSTSESTWHDLTVYLNPSKFPVPPSPLGGFNSSTGIRVMHPTVILIEALERFYSGAEESLDEVLRTLVACYWLEADCRVLHGARSVFSNWQKARLLERPSLRSVDWEDRSRDIMDRLEESRWNELQGLSQRYFGGRRVESAKLADLIAHAYTGLPDVHPGNRVAPSDVAPRQNSIITWPVSSTVTESHGSRPSQLLRQTSKRLAKVRTPDFNLDMFKPRSANQPSLSDDEVSPTAHKKLSGEWPSTIRSDSVNAFSPTCRHLVTTSPNSGSAHAGVIAQQNLTERSRSVSSLWGSSSFRRSHATTGRK